MSKRIIKHYLEGTLRKRIIKHMLRVLYTLTQVTLKTRTFASLKLSGRSQQVVTSLKLLMMLIRPTPGHPVPRISDFFSSAQPHWCQATFFHQFSQRPLCVAIGHRGQEATIPRACVERILPRDRGVIHYITDAIDHSTSCTRLTVCKKVINISWFNS